MNQYSSCLEFRLFNLTYTVTITPITVNTPATIPTMASTLSALLGGGASLNLGSEMLMVDEPLPLTFTLTLLFRLLSLVEPVDGVSEMQILRQDRDCPYLSRQLPGRLTQSWSGWASSCT